MATRVHAAAMMSASWWKVRGPAMGISEVGEILNSSSVELHVKFNMIALADGDSLREFRTAVGSASSPLQSFQQEEGAPSMRQLGAIFLLSNLVLDHYTGCSLEVSVSIGQ